MGFHTFQNCFINKGVNNYHITLLKNLYGGESGETFCVLQFSTYAFTLKGKKSEFSNVFFNILKDEQIHQNTLGELIVSQGGDLVLENIEKNISFTKNIKNMFENCIEIKEKSIIEYKLAIKRISDLKIKKILKNILADEQKHLCIIKETFDKYMTIL